jgi:hypothetical protein
MKLGSPFRISLQKGLMAIEGVFPLRASLFYNKSAER